MMDWRKRFSAATVTLPMWAKHTPERCAYFSNADGAWQLYAWDRATDRHRLATQARIGTLLGAIDRRGDWLYWFDDQTGDESGNWMRQPFDGGDWQLAFPDLPKGRNHGLLLSDSFALVGLSLTEGFTVFRVDQHGNTARLYRHPRQPVYVTGLSEDQTLFTLEHSEGGRADKPDVRVYSVDGAVVADASDGPELALRDARWSRVVGDQQLLVHHERDGFVRPELWAPQRGERTALDIPLDGTLLGSWYPDGTAILVHRQWRGRSELYRFELGTSGLEPLPTPEGVVDGVRVRDDGEVWYSWQSSAAPAEVRSSDGGVVLRPTGESRPPGVAFSAHSVGDVQVFVAEPPGDRPFPTIFQIHGGPAAQDTDAYRPATQAFVDHGFAVVMVNYRGSSGYGRAWRDVLVGNPGFPELEDIARVRDWAIEQGIADPLRLVLHGGSWGGYLTLLGLARQPEAWALGMAAVPIGDWVANYEDSAPMLKAYCRTLFGGSPGDNPELYRERSPISYVEDVQAPLLLVVGENDPRCPIRQAEMYIARLRELGKEHQVYRFDAGHGAMVVNEQVHIVETELDFLNRCLSSPAPH